MTLGKVKWKQVAVDGRQVISGVPVEGGFVRAYLHGFSDFSVPEVVFTADDLHIVNVYIVFVFDCMLSNRCKGGACVSGNTPHAEWRRRNDIVICLIQVFVWF